MKWPVGLSDDGHPRPFDAADVALPGQRLRLPTHVSRVFVTNLANEQRRRVDHRDPQRPAASIPRLDHQIDRIVETSIIVGQDTPSPLTSRCRQRHLPAGDGLSARPLRPRGHEQGWLLSLGKAVDLGFHDQLATANDLGHTVNHWDQPLVTIDHVGGLAGLPPREPRRFDPDAGRWADPGPGGDDSRR